MFHHYNIIVIVHLSEIECLFIRMVETSYKKIVSEPSVYPSRIGNEKIESLRSISFIIIIIDDQLNGKSTHCVVKLLYIIN